jgi:hypothetical protein
MRTRVWLWALAGWIAAGGILVADTVYMADGRILHGKVVETPDTITLTTRIGTITFNSGDVSHWEKDDTGLPSTAPSSSDETPPATPAPPAAAVPPLPPPPPPPAAPVAQPPVAPTPPPVAKVPAATEPAVAAATPQSSTTQPAGAERAVPTASRKNEAAIRALIASRWNDLASLTVTADEQITGDQPGSWHVQFRFFGDRAYWERTPAAGSSGTRVVRSLMTDKVIVLDQSGVTIFKPTQDSFKIDDDLDVALGFRAPLDTSWLTPDATDAWKLKFPGGGAVNLTLSIANADKKKITRVIMLDPTQEYAVKGVTVSRKAIVLEQITAEGFEDVGGWKLPGKISVQMFDDMGQPTRQIEISVTSYVLNDVKNTPDSYSNFWPAGTPVNDQSQSAGQSQNSDQSQN